MSNNKKYAQKKYIETISNIANNKEKHHSQEYYGLAKTFLRQVHPEWDDVKIETTILWDVRDFHQNFNRKKHA